MRYEKSCGGVILRKNGNDFNVLLIKHNGGHWSFPKGHVEGDESNEETAKREIFEEVGLKVFFEPGFEETITYNPKDGVLKDVIFFLGFTNESDIKIQEEEICDYKWVNITDAFDIITYDSDKNVLSKVICYLDDLS